MKYRYFGSFCWCLSSSSFLNISKSPILFVPVASGIPSFENSPFWDLQEFFFQIPLSVVPYSKTPPKFPSGILQRFSNIHFEIAAGIPPEIISEVPSKTSPGVPSGISPVTLSKILNCVRPMIPSEVPSAMHQRVPSGIPRFENSVLRDVSQYSF